MQDHLLQAALPDLYESDTIFDKFEVAWTPDAKYLATGIFTVRIEGGVPEGKCPGLVSDMPIDIFASSCVRRANVSDPQGRHGRDTSVELGTECATLVVAAFCRHVQVRVGPL